MKSFHRYSIRPVLAFLVLALMVIAFAGCASISNLGADPAKEAATATSVCSGVKSGIDTIVLLRRTNVISQDAVTAIRPDVELVGKVCSGPHPPTLLDVTSAAFALASSHVTSTVAAAVKK